jgi:hypothetical protein
LKGKLVVALYSSDPINKASLDTIETAQCVFCLDKPAGDMVPNFSKYRDKAQTEAVNVALYGGVHSCWNRWFDICFQVLSAAGPLYTV